MHCYPYIQLPAATLLVNLIKFSKNIALKLFFENYDNHAELKNELAEFQTAEILTEEIQSLICETYLRTEQKIDSLENIPAT